MLKCSKCGRTFEPPTRVCPDDGTLLKNPVVPEEQPIGRTLDGKYRIDGFLKRGGMGAVYRGTHLLLGKPVAIKLIRQEIVTSSDMIERFFREARAAAKLSHPNIVTVHDLGQTEDGTLYIIMELVEGSSLKEIIQKEGPLSTGRALTLARGVASALALAHRKDIVHRDLKPQNIMISRDSEGHECPKLLDFGIAKTLEPDTPALTSTGMVLGTPHYMSAEQAKGKPADRRSDLYALGIILYEMLVGKVPFDDSSIPAILVKHLTEPPKPPTTLRAGIPEAVEALILRCLEKEPEKRFQSAEDFMGALSAMDQTGARPLSETTRGVTPVKPQLPPVPDPPPPHTMAGAASVAAPRLHVDSGTVRAHEIEVRAKGSRLGVMIAAVLLLAGGAAAAYFLTRPSPTEVPAEAEPVAAARITEPPIETEPVAAVEPEPDPETPSPSAAAEEPAAPPPPPKSAAVTKPVSAEPAPPLAPPVSAQPLPETEPAPPPRSPTFSIDCQGVRDACGTMRTVLRDALQKKGMQPARPEQAELLVALVVEEIESHAEEQFGTTFVTRTYSVAGDADVPRFGDIVALPAHTFSFDTRFGQDKLREQARVISSDAADELSRYWSSKIGER
ncbi:MAG TPA: serine/threonine-protein kinase [Vicinamibacteria bacterium]|nr:serine/threonine-protein kinase [Vicinamibacteria bacterium]